MAEKNDEEKEGYDVEFVNNIPTDEIECVICLQILREPMQANPCGHRFCKNCINKAQKERQGRPSNVFVCPLDRNQVQVFPDVGKQREILNLQVKCENHQSSCTWTGELREFEKHMDDCHFVCLECENKCGTNNILRNRMQHHLEFECSKNVFPCKYVKIGCQVKGTNKFLSEHLKEDIDDHVTLQMEHQHELKEIIAKQNVVVVQQEGKIAQQEKTINELKLNLKQQEEKFDKVSEDHDEKINRY